MLSKTGDSHPILLGLFIGLSYLVGIFSYMHYPPSSFDLLIGAQVSMVLAFGLVIFFAVQYKKLIVMSLSGLIWFGFGLLILAQPLINTIDYPDSLLFPISICVLLTLVSIAVKQVMLDSSQGEQFQITLAIFLLMGGVLTSISLMAEFAGIKSFLLIPTPNNWRPVANVGQPNQAAFILGFAIIAALYLKEKMAKIQFSIVLIGIFLFVLAFGVALTASRGGMLMMFGIPIMYALLIDQSIKKRALYWIGFTTILAAAYALGNYLFSQYSFEGVSGNAVARLVASENVNERGLFQQLAISIFKEHPVTGLGWGNYAKGGLAHAAQSEWLILVQHTHFLFTQIAAELGILGLSLLLPLFWILYKNINFKMTPVRGFAVMLVALTLVYSMSEFPLWYLRFSLIFAVSLTLIDPSAFKIKWSNNVILSLLGIVLFFGSIYYHYEYIRYSTYTDLAYAGKINSKQVLTLERVFGFKQFREHIFFYNLPLNDVKLSDKIMMGERVLNTYPTSVLVEKQGIYEALNKNTKMSLQLFQVGCVYDYFKRCAEVEQRLELLAKGYPAYFEQIKQDFEQWKKKENIILPQNP